jgi:hypothetical protein
MRSLIIGHSVIVLTMAATACADPVAPTLPGVDDRSTIARVARGGPTAPASVPDSVGIPPSIPPIFEQAPPELDTAQ